MSTLTIESLTPDAEPETEFQPYVGETQTTAGAIFDQVLAQSGVMTEPVPLSPDSRQQKKPTVKRPTKPNETHVLHTMRPGEDGEDLVKVYLTDIGKVPLLTKEDEVQLSQAIEKGDAARAALPEAKNSYQKRKLRREIAAGEEAEADFVRANLRLVVSIAKRYQSSGVPLLDLIQDGNLGLMHAVEKFEWRKGFKFSTYATWWIKQAITRGIPEQNRNIRIPAHAVDKLKQLAHYRKTFFNEEGREPTVTELAYMLRDNDYWTYQRISDLLVIDQDVVQLENTLGVENEAEIGDFIPDARTTAEVDNKAAEIGHQTMVNTMLAFGDLNDKERAVLQWRFGLVDGESRNLKETGELMDLSRERVRQIENKALAKLKDYGRDLDLTLN